MTLYDTIGRGYAAYRRPDPRIAAAIEGALGDAAGVVNIGAGAGSYEPPGRTVLAVEPSDVMIRQRPAPPRAAPCVRGSAEALPLETASVDAAMAVLSAHHWSDLERGLREMARVARRRVVLLTWVPPPTSTPTSPTSRTSSPSPRSPPPPDSSSRTPRRSG
jgi:SAM-dependent methyltransferase